MCICRMEDVWDGFYIDNGLNIWVASTHRSCWGTIQASNQARVLWPPFLSDPGSHRSRQVYKIVNADITKHGLLSLLRTELYDNMHLPIWASICIVFYEPAIWGPVEGVIFGETIIPATVQSHTCISEIEKRSWFSVNCARTIDHRVHHLCHHCLINTSSCMWRQKLYLACINDSKNTHQKRCMISIQVEG